MTPTKKPTTKKKVVTQKYPVQPKSVTVTPSNWGSTKTNAEKAAYKDWFGGKPS